MLSSSSSVASLFPNKIFSRAVLRTKYAPAVHNQSSRVHFHSSFYLKSHQKLQYLHLQADIGEEADVQASFSASCFPTTPSVSPCFNVKETFLNFLQLMKDMRKTHHQTEYNPALAQALDVSGFFTSGSYANVSFTRSSEAFPLCITLINSQLQTSAKSSSLNTR